MPQAHILVIDILPSGGGDIKETADAAINKTVLAHFVDAPYVRFLDLRPLFLKNGVLDYSLFYDPNLTPPHYAIHPNTVGQRKMAAAVSAAMFQ
jgi:hypothetical protein